MVNILSLGMNHTTIAIVPLVEGLDVPTVAASNNAGIGYMLAKITEGLAVYVREEIALNYGGLSTVNTLDREGWRIGVPGRGGEGCAAMRVAEGDVIPPTVEIDGVVYRLWFADHMGYQPVISVHYTSD